ncbi:dipicolinic acid synthetase subunit A [Siminovitchia sediminis]|uniref:Dipicolinic acid synthetase subunit A n=1 Tax=Siminovitchia sediminis TaxID=1274353 RepID=A0ABW4KD35_9BACI
MKRNINLLIMGGDQRYVEVIHQLSSQGIQIFLEGFEQLSFSHPHIHNGGYTETDVGKLDAILLPLNGTDSEGHIEALYSNQPVRISSDILQKTPEHCVVYTGISGDFLDSAAKQAGRKLVRLMDRDDIAIMNSIPTAEAALGAAINETDFTVHSSNVLILGFGRVGMTLSRLFDAVGAHVTVGARKDSDFALIMEMGLRPIHLDNLSEYISECNICINSVPYLLLDSFVLSKADRSLIIIDIASRPGGTDFEFARKQGIKAVHALGLPGQTAPKTAGEVISGVLLKLLGE